MSRLFITAALASQLALCGSAWAASLPGEQSPPPQAERPEAPDREAVLNTLFDKLAHAKSAPEARGIESAIFALWMESDSPSVDLLMGRGVDALQSGEFDRALFYFNEVISLAPDYVEGWDKRAAVYILKDDYASALKDIERLLKIEPRHFGAMGALAIILEDLGDKKGALDLYRRALKIDPWLDGAADAEKALAVDVEGRGI
ncbi:tetratricopeptide repeat protein [Parvibaculum sedimenti]|uniref:Tetratricopeptide repeat protein n=1 Tax=Parvibaculum sedimenti TaxID=2608632 RepID=A0A6N6VPC8_9HYPH|nr:tetratricopeptide repeat protein [Parvibaculum sedimenti]KAB7740744.1 tetratricopeptide repeat protein [Parvibaculum sedimenti]